ncbi:MAG: endoglucanase [Actinomycetota bacterium]|nr:endoglucanase [Actinomycetota bacterium]
MTANGTGFLRCAGQRFVDSTGEPVRLRGVGVAGWMNLENFATGHSGNESLVRRLVRDVLGQERYELFFDRFLTSFFGPEDAALLAGAGMNCVRLPVNYRHFEDDAHPFEHLEEGFRHLDRAIDHCAAQGIYSVIDLHALPGSQNHHWHSDNFTHHPAFWDHPHFQDRAVALWEFIADHYKDNPWVAGYNPVNEPADESRAVVGPVYSRLVNAIRSVDANHILFLDGNTYSMEFDVFDETWDNTVYVCHDYAAIGLGGGGTYPGECEGVHVDLERLRTKYRERTELCEQTDSPVWVGEFGPLYTGDPALDATRRQLLTDQLGIYRQNDASWSVWHYKDLGMQGAVIVRPDTAYRLRFDDFVAKKTRLCADQWGNDGWGDREATAPFYAMMDREFPAFEPYPWGRFDFVRTLILNIAVAQPLAYEYAELFRGLSDDDVVELADSFALRNCDVRPGILEQLSAG